MFCCTCSLTFILKLFFNFQTIDFTLADPQLAIASLR